MLISSVGSSDDTALLCHTNHPPDGANSGGDWHAPAGTRVNGNDVPGFTRDRGPMVVRLKRITGTPAQGIYHCSISDDQYMIHIVYVGLYNMGGGIYDMDFRVVFPLSIATGVVKLSGDMIFSLNSNNQFTLTCISTGGPATTVTWTRDSTTVTEGNDNVINTVVDNRITGQSIHILLVTGRVEGVYRCSVNNSVSTGSSLQLNVTGAIIEVF